MKKNEEMGIEMKIHGKPISCTTNMYFININRNQEWSGSPGTIRNTILNVN